jgi:hypothetical protein
MIMLFCSVLALIFFGKMEEFRTWQKALFQVLNASLGSYNSDQFEKDASKEFKTMGNTFFIAYLILNLLLLTNYVVAVMTDRYVALQESRLGLYYDDLLSNMAEYKSDSRYGFLIVNVMPFNILAMLFSPLFIFIKN